MKDMYIQSRVAMAKTLHANGVKLADIAVATGLNPRKIKSELKRASMKPAPAGHPAQ